MWTKDGNQREFWFRVVLNGKGTLGDNGGVHQAEWSNRDRAGLSMGSTEPPSLSTAPCEPRVETRGFFGWCWSWMERAALGTTAELFKNKNWPETKKIFTGCSDPLFLLQPIGRGRISRKGDLNVRESRERRDKIFAGKQITPFWPEMLQKIRSKIAVSIFNRVLYRNPIHFFGRGNTNFWGGGITSKLASQCPS